LLEGVSTVLFLLNGEERECTCRCSATNFVCRFFRSEIFRELHLHFVRRIILWVGHVAAIRELKYVYHISLGKLPEERPIWRRRPGTEDNIETDLEGIRCEVVA
jgi:hypothetical protein